MEGYIAVHRQILDSEIFASEKGFKIWMWLLLKARYNDGFTTVSVGNGQHTIPIKRGQLLFGRFKAEEELNISGSTIYKWIGNLSEKKMILVESSTHYSIITIVKYNEYQEKSNSHSTADGQQADNRVTPDGQQSNTIKKVNKVNKVEESIYTDSDFPMNEEQQKYWKVALEFINSAAPQLLLFKEPLTPKEYFELREKFESIEIQENIEALGNFYESHKKYQNVSKTIELWILRNKERNKQTA